MKIDKIIYISTNNEGDIIGLSDNGNLYKLTLKGWSFLIGSPDRDEKVPALEKPEIAVLDDIIK